ncbi:cytochrome P450 [Amanita rubescens]|nr:cytochrome P450 [Amanita rubescens]
MSIHESIRVVTAHHLIVNFAPWLLTIPLAKEVAQRKAEMGGRVESTRKSRASDVFTMLKSKLTIQELGKWIIFLNIDAETTAKTFAAALAYLAIHQDVQQEAYEQIISIAGETADPRFEDYDKLNKVLAIFLEALRLYPPAYMMMRQAYEDTVVTVPKPFGQEGATVMPIAKGTWIICDLIGAQYNPRYFDEPEKFKPSRWSKVSSDSDAFSAFSIGQRACVGRKFAAVEGVSFLSVLLRDWRIEPMLSDGEPIQSWMDRVFKGRVSLTLGISDVPVKLSRR